MFLIGNVEFQVIGGTAKPGSDDGPAQTASFHHPSALTMNGDSTLIVADTWNNKLRQIIKPCETGTIVTTFCGSGKGGHCDGNKSIAQFYWPTDIVYDHIDTSFVIADHYNHCIRRMKQNGLL